MWLDDIDQEYFSNNLSRVFSKVNLSFEEDGDDDGRPDSSLVTQKKIEQSGNLETEPINQELQCIPEQDKPKDTKSEIERLKAELKNLRSTRLQKVQALSSACGTDEQVANRGSQAAEAVIEKVEKPLSALEKIRRDYLATKPNILLGKRQKFEDSAASSHPSTSATLESLRRFQKILTNSKEEDSSAKPLSSEENPKLKPSRERGEPCKLHFLVGCKSCWSDDAEKNKGPEADAIDDSWLSHRLVFEPTPGERLSSNVDDLVVIDPRIQMQKFKQK